MIHDILHHAPQHESMHGALLLVSWPQASFESDQVHLVELHCCPLMTAARRALLLIIDCGPLSINDGTSITHVAVVPALAAAAACAVLP